MFFAFKTREGVGRVEEEQGVGNDDCGVHGGKSEQREALGRGRVGRGRTQALHLAECYLGHSPVSSVLLCRKQRK